RRQLELLRQRRPGWAALAGWCLRLRRRVALCATWPAPIEPGSALFEFADSAGSSHRATAGFRCAIATRPHSPCANEPIHWTPRRLLSSWTLRGRRATGQFLFLIALP